MDTSKLVVGQRVVMVSGEEGPYGCEGRVIEVKSDGGVTVHGYLPDGKPSAGSPLHFDSEGKGLPWPEGTYECGPWHIARILNEDEKW